MSDPIAPRRQRKVDAVIEAAVLRALGQAAFIAELLHRLPYHRSTVEQALQRLKIKRLIERCLIDGRNAWRKA